MMSPSTCKRSFSGSCREIRCGQSEIISPEEVNILFFFIDPADRNCEAPFQRDSTGKLCYLLVTNLGVYWSEAVKSCYEMNSTLISIETAEKHVLLYQAVNSKY